MNYHKSKYQKRWLETENVAREALEFDPSDIAGVDRLRQDLYYIDSEEDKVIHEYDDLAFLVGKDAKELLVTTILEVKDINSAQQGLYRDEIYKIAGRMIDSGARFALLVSPKLSKGADMALESINTWMYPRGMFIFSVPVRMLRGSHKKVERMWDTTLSIMKRILSKAHDKKTLSIASDVEFQR